MNKIRAEFFFNHPKKYDVIIVGSSMSEGLALAPHIKNSTTLNFIGGATNTGLALIKASKVLPKVILIETNWLDRPVFHELVQETANKNLSNLKQILPSILEANQPVIVLANIFKVKKSFLNMDNQIKNSQRLLKINVEGQNGPIDLAKINQILTTTKSYVDYFEKNHVKIFFMDVPVDPKIYNTSRANAIRWEMNKIFASTSRIPRFSEKNELTTVDGYHLTVESRKKYSVFLANFIKHKIN